MVTMWRYVCWKWGITIKKIGSNLMGFKREYYWACRKAQSSWKQVRMEESAWRALLLLLWIEWSEV